MAFQGSLRELPLPDIIQLVAVSGKTGVFVLKNGIDAGQIFLRKGQIVHATSGALEGEQAVYELARWQQGDFVFTPGKETETQTIDKSNTNLLMEAARQIDEWKVLAKKIDSTRLVPVFAPQATGSSVSFNPAEWAVISKVDERRTIEEVASALGKGTFDVCKVVYGLLASGVLALREDLRKLPLDHLDRLAPEGRERLAEQIHRLALQLLGNPERHTEFESAMRLCRAELAAGRSADGVLSLVRAEEKLLFSYAGAPAAKAFLDRIQQVLSAV